MAKTWRPAALARSSSVGSGGGMAKSRRLPVRLKVVARLADEGAGDDAADLQRRGQLEGDLADLVEPLEAEMRLVRGDLEHASRSRCSRSACRSGCAPRRAPR